MTKIQWTAKQQKIADELQQPGATQKDVAKKLGISLQTVNKVAKALKKSGKGKPGEVIPATVSAKTQNIADASKIIMKPAVYEMTAPPVLWLAMKAAIEQWGWPKEMTPTEFLDAYLRASFAQRGIYLADYVVNKEKEDEGQKKTE